MAMILDAFVGKFKEKLSELIRDRAVGILGVEEDLQRLQRRLEDIKNRLVDAERRRYDDTAIHAWVRQLKDVMYDADDMIDLWRINDPQLLSEAHCCSFIFSCFTGLPLRNEISLQIQRLNDRLDEIYKNKSEFNLLHSGSEIRINSLNPRQTSELVDTDVVGDDIENATKDLVQRLLVGRSQQQCLFVAISGMGGIGKTTLAQKIFNDSRMQTSFSVKVWVCISQEFNEINLLKQIVSETGGKPEGAYTKTKLLRLLKKAVSGKEVFLVLDDVWEGQENNIWDKLLKNPLKEGASICRILVTTRDEKVALKMGAKHIHRVDQLSTAFGWKLLRKIVFVNGEEEDIHDLEVTGIRIVEKCQGLPLAIKVISGVLRTKDPIKKEWEEVLANNSWSMSKLPKDLRGALYLSYEVLPSHLKQCFLYLSLFPEDYMYYREDLVRMWVAEGFVKKKGDRLLEDLARGYYKKLARRNLLHIEPDYYPHGLRCKMHDLLRSLAKYLSGDEAFYGDPRGLDTNTSKSKLRRLSIAKTGEAIVHLEPTMGQDSLRTLILFRSVSRLENNDSKFFNFRFIRVLCLNGEGIQCLPNSLGNLVHLRFLDLDSTKISMIPESIGCLKNLQILNLVDCKDLHTLPRGITRLCNLRHLGMIGTPLSCLPKGIGELKQLNDLQGFLVGGGGTEERDHGCNLEELGSLGQLRNLAIDKLERASRSTTSFTFASNPHLKMLRMCCTPLDRESSDRNNIVPNSEELERLFEQLSPPPCTEALQILDYFGRGFPSWMMSCGTLFSSLTILILVDCLLCPVLPPVGQLPQLITLHISGASSVVTIGPEFLGIVNSISGEGEGSSNIRGQLRVFPKLEVLKIDNMPKWEEWSFGKEIDELVLEVLPRLKRLDLRDCPELRALPKGLSHCRFQTLNIEGARKLTRVDNLPHLTTWMRVIKCGSLERVSDLPKLRELIIVECPAMTGVERLDSLQKLCLHDYSMERLPKWLLTLSQQRHASQAMTTSPDDDDDNFLIELHCNKEMML